MPFNSASDAFELHPDIRSYGTTLSDEETRAFEAAATGAGGEASALEADIAAGRRAPKELERLLGEIARWE